MGAFGAMFPGRRIRHEAGEAGNAQEWWSMDLIDLENNTVTLRRPAPEPEDVDATEDDRGEGPPPGA